MLNIFKTVNNLIKTVHKLSDKAIILEKENEKITKILKNNAVFDAIGIPYSNEISYSTACDQRILLLIEARKRGYFDNNKYFNSGDDMWKDTAYFKHHYSNIADAYRYWEDSDSLHIPVIGIKQNISACCLCIYKQGKWARIFKTNNKLN